jgi:hypothetical protein
MPREYCLAARRAAGGPGRMLNRGRRS